MTKEKSTNILLELKGKLAESYERLLTQIVFDDIGKAEIPIGIGIPALQEIDNLHNKYEEALKLLKE